MDKQLIVFPGDMAGVFFKNELPYIADQFSSIVVATYPGDENVYAQIAKEYDLSYVVVPNFEVTSFFKALLQFFTDKTIRIEITEKNLRQKVYAFLYAMWANSAEKKLRAFLTDEVDSIAYSFWLSRGAFASCRLSEKQDVVKAVSRAHRYDLYEDQNSLSYLPFRHYLAQTLDEVDFVSEDGLNYFKSKYSPTKAKLNIRRLGTCDINYRKKIRDKPFVCIASCSSIIKVKRIDLIIDVLSKVHVPFRWIHIGEGDLRECMESLAASKLPCDSYTFLGSVDNSEIPRIYEEYDVDYLINMSDSEGIPVSIMEAFSMGIPVIARDVGGNREIVDNASGLLISDDCFDSIETLLRSRWDTNAYQSKSENAYRKWRGSFRASTNYRAFFRDISQVEPYDSLASRSY